MGDDNGRQLRYRCPICQGGGEIYFDDHHPFCNGDNCGEICPVQNRDVCPCCDGRGNVEYRILVHEALNLCKGNGNEAAELIEQYVKETEEAQKV